MMPYSALWRLLIAAAGTVVLIILLVSAISEPVANQTGTYAARFTDASGLHAGADVRIRGVLVGRVASVDLKRDRDQSVALVHFTLDRQYGVVAASRLAVKYQTLTGARYLDVINPAEGDAVKNMITDVPTTMTQPSFDVTTLFNGLQPVIATLSPEELNTFAANVSDFLAGDGGGLEPILDSMRKLTEFVADRQTVIATLMSNLTEVAGAMGGHASDMVQILAWANRPDGPIDQAMTVLDEFRKSQLYGPGFVEPVMRLLRYIGFPPGEDRHVPATDIDRALDTAFNNVDNTIDAFKLIPAMWENIPDPSPTAVPEPCSQGRAALPEPIDVLVNGQRVVLCNQ